MGEKKCRIRCRVNNFVFLIFGILIILIFFVTSKIICRGGVLTLKKKPDPTKKINYLLISQIGIESSGGGVSDPLLSNVNIYKEISKSRESRESFRIDDYI